MSRVVVECARSTADIESGDAHDDSAGPGRGNLITHQAYGVR